MLGIELAARFALAPNSLSYCGKKDFREKFAAYMANRGAINRKALEGSLRSFAAHFAYLSLIAKSNGKKPFDPGVAQALWIGNGLLCSVKKAGMQRLVRHEFSGPGMLPKSKAARLARLIPRGALPHHSFHALYLHTITGVIRPSLKNADSCMVHWGRVLQVKGKIAIVESQRLAMKNGELDLLPCKRKLHLQCARMVMVPQLEEGEMVASHWDFAVMKLSGGQAAALEKYTRKNISALNSA